MNPQPPPAWTYGLALVGPALITVFLTPLALGFAQRRGLLDHPRDHKSHAEPVPYLGGVAMILAFAVAVGAMAVTAHPTGADLGALAVILGLGTGLAGLGLLDDLRDLPITPRLGAEILAALVVCACGTRAHLRGVPSWADVVVSVVWIVGITNAFNLLDNADGLSAGVAALGALSLAGVGLINGQYFVPLLALAVAGCAVGFLPHNFHPAKIFMGDAGSLFLGFVLAVLALRLRVHSAHQVGLAVPLVALAVPLFDTGLVVVERVAHGRNPFRGFTDHASHRLVSRGWPIPWAVGSIYAAAAVSGSAAVLLTRSSRVVGLVVVAGLAVALTAVGLILGRVKVYPVAADGADEVRQRKSTS